MDNCGFSSALLLFVSYCLVVLATPADVAMLMQLGVDGVFVGSGIFKSSDPVKRAKAMVQAVSHYNDPKILARVSEDLGEPMVSEIYDIVFGWYMYMYSDTN